MGVYVNGKKILTNNEIGTFTSAWIDDNGNWIASGSKGAYKGSLADVQ
jgi:hypothetical protein